MAGAARLRTRLIAAKEAGRGLVMGFLPTGFPDVDTFRASTTAAFAAGLDVLEASLPGAAPAIDGATIARAADLASPQFTHLDEALELLARSRHRDDDPIVILAYPHHVADLGIEALASAAAAAGLDGILLPGTPIDEQLAAAEVAREHGIEPVLFVHLYEELATLAALPPTHMLRRTPPLVYLQSADMHTGSAFDADKARERLSEMREALPNFDYHVVVGFGIRGADQVSVVIEHGADGAVIGTALVEAAEHGPAGVAALIRSVRPALAHTPSKAAS